MVTANRNADKTGKAVTERWAGRREKGGQKKGGQRNRQTEKWDRKKREYAFAAAVIPLLAFRLFLSLPFLSSGFLSLFLAQLSCSLPPHSTGAS